MRALRDVAVGAALGAARSALAAPAQLGSAEPPAPVAEPPEPQQAECPVPCVDGIYVDEGGGGGVTVGRTWETGAVPNATYLRIDSVYLEQVALGRGRREGPNVALTFGVEGWMADGARGIGLPSIAWAGWRQPFAARGRGAGSFFGLGLGWSWALLDVHRGDAGFGVLAPKGQLSAGIDLAGVRVGAELTTQYRWQWGAPDRWQHAAGLSVWLTAEQWED
ncbi:MAG: hypothetical protein IT376_08970 [Polyangiaceae bacterium]|nr:hypothetical protein [Polyangiaceae bacterium]